MRYYRDLCVLTDTVDLCTLTIIDGRINIKYLVTLVYSVGEIGSSCYNFHVFKHTMQTKRAALCCNYVLMLYFAGSWLGQNINSKTNNIERKLNNCSLHWCKIVEMQGYLTRLLTVQIFTKISFLNSYFNLHLHIKIK